MKVALRDQSGAAIGADVFRGQPVIVSMLYGSCPAACPLIVAHIKQIESQLPPDVRAKTRVLLVSFDPERDTPERLRELAEAHRAALARWRFATGADDEVRELANALGVTYRKGEGGAIAHDSVISVLDAEGRVVARVNDPSADLAPLASAIRLAARTGE
jgi:protein SCO1/2